MNFSDRYHSVEAIRAATARLEVAREERRQRMKAEAKAESERLAREVKAVDNELLKWIRRAEKGPWHARQTAEVVCERLASGYDIAEARRAIAELMEACGGYNVDDARRAISELEEA